MIHHALGPAHNAPPFNPDADLSSDGSTSASLASSGSSSESDINPNLNLGPGIGSPWGAGKPGNHSDEVSSSSSDGNADEQNQIGDDAAVVNVNDPGPEAHQYASLCRCVVREATERGLKIGGLLAGGATVAFCAAGLSVPADTAASTGLLAASGVSFLASVVVVGIWVALQRREPAV